MPAPALDSEKQPHYAYYMGENGKLDLAKYEQEMRILFKCIEQAVRDNHETAFENKGINRLVLSEFGQGAFLGSLSEADQASARNIFNEQQRVFMDNIADLEIKVVRSKFNLPKGVERSEDLIIGDIRKTAKEHDLIINAWDPHSAPGNGNDNDRTFDGALGSATAILLTQTSWLNPLLRTRRSLVGVV